MISDGQGSGDAMVGIGYAEFSQRGVHFTKFIGNESIRKQFDNVINLLRKTQVRVKALLLYSFT